MGWKTVIIGSECTVSLSMNRMRITINGDYHNIPLCDLDTVIFSHQKCVITIPILSKLVENNINVIICNEKNDPIGVFNAFNSHSLVFKQLNNQINWKKTRKKKLWKIIIENKIKSEIEILQLMDGQKSIIEELTLYHNSVYNDDQTNREAASARAYFIALFGREFIRDDETNPKNMALNYGYKILASYISKCLVSRGLITQLGIHHIGESNPFNLTYDFIEPLRAIIDFWVALNIDEKFNVAYKRELVSILESRVYINNKWMRLTDAIEDLVDSYISFMNEKSEEILRIDLSEGIRQDE